MFGILECKSKKISPPAWGSLSGKRNTASPVTLDPLGLLGSPNDFGVITQDTVWRSFKQMQWEFCSFSIGAVRKSGDASSCTATWKHTRSKIKDRETKFKPKHTWRWLDFMSPDVNEADRHRAVLPSLAPHRWTSALGGLLGLISGGARRKITKGYCLGERSFWDSCVTTPQLSHYIKVFK